MTNQYPGLVEATGQEEQEDQPEIDDDLTLAEPHNDLPRFQQIDEPETHSPVPSLFTFSQVLMRFTPSLERLFLAMLPDGTPVFCAAEDLCHVALAGATDGGKSSIMRMLVSQLCKSGASVLLLNPHYTHYDLKHKEDWTPFEPYLVYDPMECRKYEVIEFYLKQVATELLPKRLEKYAHSNPLGRPYFLALDELPAIIKHVPNASGYLEDLLREGRKVGIFLITAAQDFLVKTISPAGSGGAVRECYRTAYYVGGDATTAKILLDVPVRTLPESELGRGTVMLHSGRVKLVKQAALARVPYVDNQALYRLLGPSTYVPGKLERGDEIALGDLRPGRTRNEQEYASLASIPSYAAPRSGQPPAATPLLPRTGSAGPRPVPARLQQVAYVYEPGMSLTWLAGQLGVNEEKAYTWLREAKARGLIQVRVQRQETAAVPLPASYQSKEQPIPTLQDVIAAFPDRKPSKRDIQKHFGITDHQAYKLYRQLDE